MFDESDEKVWQQHNARRLAEFNHPEGSPCPTCNGSGHVLTVWSNDEYYHGLMSVCPECGAVHQQEDTARKAGNAPTFGDYIDLTDWQRDLHRKAAAFAQHPAGCFYIGGQTATGKSHLCSKVYYHIMANGSSGLNYQPWKSFTRRTAKDWNLLETAKGCNVLWLDGFLDVVSSRGTPPASDLDKALEIIEARTASGKITIISSCWTPERLEDIAPQIASRIERSAADGLYFLSTPDGKEKRWRKLA